MPTYDYQCRSCRHTIEVIHSMMEEGPTTCERCGGQLRRVMFPAGIIFKGSGFYKTDSRSSSSDSGASSAAKPAAASDGTPTPTGDSKAAGGGGADSSGGAPASSVSDSAKKE